ncbi:MAG: F0F1 ATP synthase subunit delta [Gemmatimonadota bacterium]
MRIDWFTFVAQLFNFALLVWLLKRILYRPVLEAIARREEGIQEQLEGARRIREEADTEREQLRGERNELAETGAEYLRKAEAEAEARRKELAEEVRAEVRELRREWQESLRRQRSAFLEELRRAISKEMYGAVRRVLEELADAELESRAVRVFLGRLGELGDDGRREIVEAAAAEGGAIRVRTSFPLAPELRKALGADLERWIGQPLELRFEHDPELSLGIELRAGDRKVAWSVASYLDALEAEAASRLEAETR